MGAKRARIFSLLTVLATAAPALRAAPAHLVHDTDPTPIFGSTTLKAVAGGGPGGVVFFLAERPTPGSPLDPVNELWVCNAAGEHPMLLRDRLLNAYDLFVQDGRAFFNGDDGIHGGEPWTSDGTVEGTRMIADVVPGPGGSYPYNWVFLDGAVYFVDRHGGGGGLLWKTDAAGSAAEPVHAVPHTEGGPSRVGTLIRSGGALYGWFDDGVHGTELWRTDGTPQGSRLVRDINPGPGSSSGGSIVDLDGVVLFAAWDDEGPCLWRAGESEEGATRIHPVDAERLQRVGSRVYFPASDLEHGSEPWQTDGTTAGTHMVADIVPGPRGSGPSDFRLAGSTVYFSADVPGLGSELWKALPDGGAALVKDVAPDRRRGSPSPSTPGEWARRCSSARTTASTGPSCGGAMGRRREPCWSGT